MQKKKKKQFYVFLSLYFQYKIITIQSKINKFMSFWRMAVVGHHISDTHKKRNETEMKLFLPIFRRHFIYFNNLNNKAISLQEFIDELLFKCNLENIC